MTRLHEAEAAQATAQASEREARASEADAVCDAEAARKALHGKEELQAQVCVFGGGGGMCAYIRWCVS